MNLNIASIFIILLLVVWVVQALVLISSDKIFSWKSVLNFTTSLFLLVGASGFFGSALSAFGGLDGLPNTFEWPIGGADNVIVSANGDYIVPHTYSGRVQVYAENLVFKRGWTVNAAGGDFAITNATGDNFCLYTARSDLNLQYNLHGEAIPNVDCHEGFSRKLMRNNGQSLKIPTPVYYIAFTNPFIAWVFCAIGIGLHFNY